MMSGIMTGCAAVSAVLAGVLAFGGAALAGEGGCLVGLVNGGRVVANEVSVEDGRLRLVYPVGEACIPLGSVESVTCGGVLLELLQCEGEYVPGPAAVPVPAPPTRAAARAAEPKQRGASMTDSGWGVGTSGWGPEWAKPGHRMARGPGPAAAGIGTSNPSSLAADNLVDQSDFLSDEELAAGFDELFPELVDDDVIGGPYPEP